MTPVKHIENQIRSFQGPLTAELLREPGKFGLGQVPRTIKPDATTSLVCGYCSTGCSLQAHLQEGQAVNLTPDPEYPVNLGMACPKGWESLTPLSASDRATTPLYRDDRSEAFQPIDWKKAAGIFCDRMRSVQNRHGAESAAFLSTGQMCTEEMALLGAFAKFEMGMVHGDGNTRQCMATSVVAYKESFGFDAPPYTYADFEASDVIVLIGSNICIAHPIMWQRILRNPHNPEIIVIDPRKTETAMQATQHVPLRPKSDLVLLYGIANLIIERGWTDQSYIENHTNGFDEFSQHVARFTPELVAEKSGISATELELLARKIGEGQRVSLWWTMGVNQGYESTRTAQAIINIALMTGNMGKPGTGANSVTGQCNAMGSRLFSNTTNLLGGHDFRNAAHRQKVAGVMGIDERKIPNQPSWAYDQIIDGIECGKIKALWVIATNGAHSWVHQRRFRDLLGKLEFLVVQDLYPTTETAQLADLMLPAAGWGEKEGTLVNSERRIGLVKRVSQSPGRALSDFSIFRLMATKWGSGNWIERWKSPESGFRVLQELSEGQPCDISGIQDYREIDRAGGIQWPFPKEERPMANQRRLFEDGRFYTDDGKASFCFEEPSANPEEPTDEYPFVLLTGRGSSAQWHTETRTAKSRILRKLHSSQPDLEIHPDDAARLGIQDRDEVRIQSHRGKMRAVIRVTPSVQTGTVFAAMHHPELNQLTPNVFDPYSRQPNYKAGCVSVEPV